jgi:2-polyprenyl-6-methoxyphenol hydroxylase-like FAD-dependent oxidoreductase
VTAPSAFDVVIGGGGTAGSSVAAALGEFGYEVLIVEPGLDGSKRLAGELIHPPGVTDLAELGLLEPLSRAGVAPVLGFAVVPDADSDAYLLPYGAIPGLRRHGFAMDHAVMTSALLGAVRRRPHVTTWFGARVTGVDLDHADYAKVAVATVDGERRLRTRLLVAADGSTSILRRLAGIGHEKIRISHMIGYLLRGASLPHPGFGHVFLGGPAPTLAYAIGDDVIRVMFDIPGNPYGVEAPQHDLGYVEALPEPFRRQVRQAMETETRLVSVNYTIVPDTVFRGRLALVGDAAGCCHPLTATGLSVCTRDAIRLRQALRETGGDIPRAVRRYARHRGGPQRTRMALAEALYQAFAARTPEMTLLREGILRFWKKSRRGRTASMALLSTHEGRMSVMALEYARVVGYALTTLIRRQQGAPWPSRRRALYGLSRATLRFALDVLNVLRPQKT